MKFSIIIPVYNVIKYLDECVESVLRQTCQDYEIILIDDGSSDGSEKKCDIYTTYKNVRCIHQKNGGLSAARNTGITVAKGEYLLFLDADDFLLDCNVLDELAKLADGCDVVAFPWAEIPDGSDRSEAAKGETCSIKLKEYYESGSLYMHDLLKKIPKAHWYSWMRIYRRIFWKENGFEFPYGLKYEDAYLSPRVIIQANRVRVTEYPIYGYRTQRRGSISGTASLKSELDKLTVVTENIKWVQNQECINDDLKCLLCNNISCLYYGALIEVTHIPQNSQKELLKRLKEEIWVCAYTVSKPQSYVAKLVKFAGVETAAKILGLRRRIKYGR